MESLQGEYSERDVLAHITKRDGIRKEQSLKEHCENTAEYASECLESIGFYHMAYLAGLLHDMGKATETFQNYLEDAFAGKEVSRGSVNHTFAGVIYLLENYHKEAPSPMEKMTAEAIAYAVGAHHGLFDCADLEGGSGFWHRLKKDREELCYEEAVHKFFRQAAERTQVETLFQKAVKEFEEFYNKTAADWKGDQQQRRKVFFTIGLLTRLLLSAVIYGDRRDTAEFMDGIEFRDGEPMSWTAERDYFEQKLALLDNKSEMNKVRSEISRQCLEAAARPDGIYRLNVPTGAGKTLCTLRYALAHAHEHEHEHEHVEKFRKKKIIFIIPLLSILDQNADVIRQYLPDSEIVLEHHSNVISEKEPGDEREELDRYETLTENWDRPVIISTLVQLLNILFAHKTSAVGRMRALCDSVIVIDEVQSLPQKTMAMFNMALNFLSGCCHATIVLSSATQPCLERLDWGVRFAEHPDLVRLDERQLKIFERSEIIDRTTPHGMDLDELAKFCRTLIEEQESLLVICNTKREARDLFELLQEEAREHDMCHLSTAMCQEHRMDVLKGLLEKLEAVQKAAHDHSDYRKVICISTQLVEAGVDFSFSCVVRVMAGIDNLAQAAGRCNRSGEYPHKGKVYLVNLKDENLSMLKEIAEAQNSTLHVLNDRKAYAEKDLTGEWAAQTFYRNLFHQKSVKKRIRYPFDDGGTELFLSELLANANPYTRKDTRFYLNQPFKTAAGIFQVFDEKTFDVLVPYGEGNMLIEQLREVKESEYSIPFLREVMRRAKRFTVSIYEWQRDRLLEKGLLEELLGGRLLALHTKAYNGRYGLDDRAELTVGDFML